METFLPAIKKLGYEGVEVPLKIAMSFPNWKQLMQDNGLRSAFVLFTDGPVAPGEAIPVFDSVFLGVDLLTNRSIIVLRGRFDPLAAHCPPSPTFPVPKRASEQTEQKKKQN